MMLSSELLRIRSNLYNLAIEILNKALRLGKVFIVTSAKKVWVENAIKRFMPNLANFFRSNHERIRVVSTNAEENPSLISVQNGARKLHALYKILESVTTETGKAVTNIISIGDSNEERQMVHSIRYYST